MTAALPLAVVAATACGGSPAVQPERGEPERGKVEATRAVPVAVTRVVGETAPADDPGELVIYSGRSESLVDPIIRQFEATTGIDVQVKYAGTNALAATLLEEGKNTPADVFLRAGPGRTGRSVRIDGRASPGPGGAHSGMGSLPTGQLGGHNRSGPRCRLWHRASDPKGTFPTTSGGSPNRSGEGESVGRRPIAPFRRW